MCIRDSAAITNEIKPTSIASMAQPTPEVPKIRACLRVTGKESRRSVRDGEELASEEKGAWPTGECAGSLPTPPEVMTWDNTLIGAWALDLAERKYKGE